MGASAFGGSFAPSVQFEKWEIRKVFPPFSNFQLEQNPSPKALAPLCGVALSNVPAALTAVYFPNCFMKHLLTLRLRKKSAISRPNPRQKWPLTSRRISSTIFSLTMPPDIFAMARKGML